MWWPAEIQSCVISVYRQCLRLASIYNPNCLREPFSQIRGMSGESGILRVDGSVSRLPVVPNVPLFA